jgi:hypothetical protein
MKTITIHINIDIKEIEWPIKMEEKVNYYF